MTTKELKDEIIDSLKLKHKIGVTQENGANFSAAYIAFLSNEPSVTNPKKHESSIYKIVVIRQTTQCLKPE